MWKRKLEEKIEATRKKMEDTAKVLGIGHPKVYQLSVELDELHNEWHQRHNRNSSFYTYHKSIVHAKEESLYYRTVV